MDQDHSNRMNGCEDMVLASLLKHCVGSRLINLR